MKYLKSNTSPIFKLILFTAFFWLGTFAVITTGLAGQFTRKQFTGLPAQAGKLSTLQNESEVSTGLSNSLAKDNGSSSSVSVLGLTSQKWWPAEVGLRTSKVDAGFTETQVAVSANQPVELVNPPAGWEFKPVSSTDETWYYLLLIRRIPIQLTEYKLQFINSGGNITYREIIINPQGELAVLPAWPDSQFLLDGNSLLVPISKRYKLPQDYVPNDLVLLNDLGVRNWLNFSLRQEAALQLQKMTKAINAAGLDYIVSSAYRSYAEQLRLYSQNIAYFGGDQAAADQVSSRPGYSEHQLGTTIDILTNENLYRTTGFGSTRLSAWLEQNAASFGFVMSFTQQSAQDTGYIYEPWHYRYIGVQNAQEFKQTSLTLDAWLRGKL